MDIKKVAEQLGLDEADIYDVVELFIQTAPADLMKLVTAYNKQDTVQINEAAHSLKGSTGTLGFIEISKDAQQVMKHARDNDFESLKSLVPPFLNRMKDLFTELKEVVKNRQ